MSDLYFIGKDKEILDAYLRSYRECFEAMNDLLAEILPRVELTEKESEMIKLSNAKYKNMIYHLRKWSPDFKKENKSFEL